MRAWVSQIDVANAWGRFVQLVMIEKAPIDDMRRIDALCVAVELTLRGIRDMHHCPGRACELCADPERWVRKRPRAERWRDPAKERAAARWRANLRSGSAAVEGIQDDDGHANEAQDQGVHAEGSARRGSGSRQGEPERDQGESGSAALR